MGIKHLQVESDSLQAISLVQEAEERHIHSNIIWKIRELLHRNWQCKLNHFWREGNSCADILAKKSIDLQLGLTFFPDPPDIVKPLLSADLIGASYIRKIVL